MMMMLNGVLFTVYSIKALLKNAAQKEAASKKYKNKVRAYKTKSVTLASVSTSHDFS